MTRADTFGIVTLHAPNGDQVGEPKMVPLASPSLWRRVLNTILRRPTPMLTNVGPTAWDTNTGDIPAGVVVVSVRVTLPDGRTTESRIT